MKLFGSQSGRTLHSGGRYARSLRLYPKPNICHLVNKYKIFVIKRTLLIALFGCRRPGSQKRSRTGGGKQHGHTGQTATTTLTSFINKLKVRKLNLLYNIIY